MGMFKRFFYKKPPEGLLEISERVFVFDCCFTTDVMDDKEYKVYVGGIVANLREYCPDASYVVFNFREGQYQTQLGNILSDYDMTVMDYPRHYENCPLLKLEMIHHFLRSSENWLSLGQHNMLLMHCERGGWPVLAFMLAALLIYRKQYAAEQKTLDMIYKQAPVELLHLMSPLNPLPSQLRYLQYVSRRNVGSAWPPLDRALMLDCVIIRVIPKVDGQGGCCPIFRIYGQDPLSADRSSKLLFSTPKRSKHVRHYKQADCEVVKIDIRCHIQGDVVLECTSLDTDLEHEVMMFRVMFNTAFIRSNILMLNREEIDILWTAKDQFPVKFRTEVLFSEIDAASSLVTFDLPAMIEEKGLPIEAFAKVREMFSNVDWSDPSTDVALSMIQQINILQEQLECDSPLRAKRLSMLSEQSPKEVKEKPVADMHQKINLPSEKLETDSPESAQKKDKPIADMLQKINLPSEKLETDSPESAQKKDKPIADMLPKISLPSEKLETDSPESAQKKEKPIADMLQKINLPSEKLETDSPESAQRSSQVPEPSHQRVVEKPHSEKSQQNLESIPSITTSNQLTPVLVPSSDLTSQVDNFVPQEPQSALQRPTQSKILTQRMSHTSPSTPTASSGSSLQVSPLPISRYHSLSSGLGITALLEDHKEENKEITHQVRTSPSRAASESPVHLSSPSSTGIVSILPSSEISPSLKSPLRNSASITKTSSIPLPPDLTKTSLIPPVSPPPPSISPTKIPSMPPVLPNPQSKTSSEPPVAPTLHAKTLSVPPVPPPPPPPPRSHLSASGQSSSLVSSSTLTSGQHKGQGSSVPPPPPPPPASPYGTSSPPSDKRPSSYIPAPPPCPSFPGSTPLATDKKTIAPPPPPPPPVPPRQSPVLLPSLSIRESCSASPTQLSGIASSAPVVTVGPPPPPPPPLCSRTTPSASVTSSAPPPPPPPGLAPKSSPHVPSVPPPPVPFNNGIKGSAAAQSHPGSNGNVPPIPGPPLMKGRPLSRQRNQDQSKKTSLKPYHWLKLTRAMQGSLWAETQKSDESSDAPEFDMAELESLFAVNVPNPKGGDTGGKSSRRSMGAKSEKVTLIDLRRAYNCEIMLTKVKVPLPDLVSSVLDLDDSALDVDQVDNLIKFCPTKEEMDLLKNYKGDKVNLGKCEQFFLELMKVPRIESKLRVFSFKIQFHTQVSDLRNNLMVVDSVSEEIRSSVKLKKIMQTILSLGNALNHGTARGSAVGFRLDSLLKLTDTRARNNKMTLMHYLCKVISEKLPELLDFSKDLVSLEASTKVQLKYLAEEMQAISKGLEKVVQELITSENDGPVSEHFRKILKEFLSFAEAEVRSLALLYSGVGRKADALAYYFGEDPARTPFEQVVSTLLNFVKLFVRAHEENCKQLELENKKAQKEVEAEKLKITPSQKELESDRMRMSAPVK